MSITDDFAQRGAAAAQSNDPAQQKKVYDDWMAQIGQWTDSSSSPPGAQQVWDQRSKSDGLPPSHMPPGFDPGPSPQPTAPASNGAGNYGYDASHPGATGNYGYQAPASQNPISGAIQGNTGGGQSPKFDPTAKPTYDSSTGALTSPAPTGITANPLTGAITSAANPWVNGINTMNRDPGQGTGGIGSGSRQDPYNSFMYDPNDPTDISVQTANGMVSFGAPVANPNAGGYYIWAGGQAFNPLNSPMGGNNGGLRA